jgi:uncharacterized protein
MSNFQRSIDIHKALEHNKVVVLYGPRQVGKTTLVKKFINNFQGKTAYYTGDDLEFANDLSKCSLEICKKMFSGLNLLVIDEAQKIENVGRAIKLVVDNMEEIRVILTGSSSFDLANKTGESLTGRKKVLKLYPISQTEILSLKTRYKLEKDLPQNLVYGAYPDILLAETYQLKADKLRELVNSYLLRDILSFHLVKDAKTIRNLLKLLAFQVGSEVSLSELASNLEIDKNTVLRHLDLLEKSFVIFSLGGFSRNLRKEVNKTQKYYFYDLGIRNSLIANLNELSLRNDVGQLWENFLLIERLKRNAYLEIYPNYYFWRTYDRKEIDFIEEIGGGLQAYEFKWRKRGGSKIDEFLRTYPNSTFQTISQDNYFEFVSY